MKFMADEASRAAPRMARAANLGRRRPTSSVAPGTLEEQIR
jgi:hypothetical protein